MALKNQLLTTYPRAHNQLLDKGSFVIKRSFEVAKLQAEVEFYRSLPTPLAPFYPRVLKSHENPDGSFEYAIEKIPGQDLSFHFTRSFADKLPFFAESLQSLGSYLDLCESRELTRIQWNRHLQEVLLDRSLSRLSEIQSLVSGYGLMDLFQKQNFSTLGAYVQYLHEKIRRAADLLTDLRVHHSHGDLCLSNIFFAEGSLHLIDPKGMVTGEDSFRLVYYDLAKLSQCFLSGYDWTVRGLPVGRDFNMENLFRNFLNQRGVSWPLLRLVESSHFFAMLPFHQESFEKVQTFARKSLAIASEF